METHDTTTDRPTDGPASPWLDARRAADYLGTQPQFVYREVAAGRIKAARLAGRRSIRVHRAELDRYLSGCVR